jgi:hypothetical protein
MMAAYPDTLFSWVREWIDIIHLRVRQINRMRVSTGEFARVSAVLLGSGTEDVRLLLSLGPRNLCGHIRTVFENLLTFLKYLGTDPSSHF